MKKYGGKSGNSQLTILHEEQVVSDHGKVTPPNAMQEENVGKNVNFRTLTVPVGNGADVAIPLESIRAISERSNYARAMIDLQADEELKDSIMVAMPKLVGEGFNMCIIHVEYEWKPPRCSGYNVIGQVLNECSKKIVSNMNNPRQATRGVLVGPNGMNGGNSKSVGKGPLNLAHGSSNNTPIIDKIDKLECQILDGKHMLVDDDGNPLVPMGNVDSESEVDVVFDEAANVIASTSFKGGSDRGYDTNSMLEQWRETERDDDYDPYNDDLYESHDMYDHLEAICDDLDITVHGRRKK
uniref:Uncharacterized protein n=1 Tax=Tanacetum cinerariifolium TaxID=118510 RepID=A0A699GS28_TANCI|nr:hypothetical protein [Tanacetum cinerariifolium]